MSSFSTQSYKVAAVVVTYGSRFNLLRQTIDAILKDQQVTKLIIVDNASSNISEIRSYISQYGDRALLICHETNLGSAGGFASGIAKAREENVEYIYLSDDDVVVSDHFIQSFELAHTVIGNNQTVLCARRKSFWAGTDVHYAPDVRIRPRKYFNVLSLHTLAVFLKALLRIRDKHNIHHPRFFFPIIPSLGWAYAGVLIPVEAAINAPLPDRSLGLYLDDIVYSWGVIDAGYPSFALMEPHLTDLELTHADSHTATGLFSPHVSPTKIYYETRNRVRVSLEYGKAAKVPLMVQTAVWCLGIGILALLRYGLNKHTVKRMYLIIEALRAGFDAKRTIPANVVIRI